MDAKMDAQPVASGNVLDFGPRVTVKYANLAQWAELHPAEADKLGKCAECGGLPWVGDYPASTGPVVSQLDAPSGQDVKRCPPCWEQIMTGAMVTRVNGSLVSVYFEANRRIAEAVKSDPVNTDLLTYSRGVQARVMADVAAALHSRDAQPSA